MKSFLHIGIDDTDSIQGGCTTYIAALIIEKLSEAHAIFMDYPNLIRLNPNVPWKTRGNGAICLRVIIDKAQRDQIIENIITIVKREADFKSPKTDPGIVLFEDKEVPQELQVFAQRTIQTVVEKGDALQLIEQFQCQAVRFKEGRGLIGALAAVGEILKGDHTYELIAYRKLSNRGTRRRINDETVFKMDFSTKGFTFNNIDSEKNRILITPRGPDPILLGIRGETSKIVKQAYAMIQIYEEVERWVIFRSNQGTDAHLRRVNQINQIHPYNPIIISGKVIHEPRTIPGRHVIFTIGDDSGTIDCAAYEPTGKFRNIVRELVREDVVDVSGGVRPSSQKIPQTLNVEKLEILQLHVKTQLRNPLCVLCKSRMESMGREKGYRCKKCGHRDKKAVKLTSPIIRGVTEKLYVPPPRAHRHLTKPLSRYGIEKRLKKSYSWITQFWGLVE